MMARVLRARVLMEQARYDLAERELLAALGHDADDPWTHAMLAVCRSMRQDHAGAREAGTRAVQVAPDLAISHHALALALYNGSHRFARKKPLAQALAAVREALRLDPHDAQSHHLAGLILWKLGRKQEALQEAQTGLQCDPQDTGCAVLRAQLLRELGRLVAAHDQSRHTLSLSPESAEAHAVYGWTLLRSGQPRQAAYHFRESLRLDPMSESAASGYHHAIESLNPVFRLMTRWNMAVDEMGGWRRHLMIAGLVAATVVTVALARQFPYLPGLVMLIVVGAIGLAAVLYAVLGGPPRAR